MAKIKTTGTTYKCDGCGSEQFISKDSGEPPIGITLKGHYDLGTGGGPVEEVFACEVDCIGNAVMKGMYPE